MKNRFLAVVFMLCALTANAQEQSGIVKTIGRPGQPGQPLGDVLVRAQGNSNMSKSDNDGCFSLVLANYKPGQAYSISRVTKIGYKLADEEVIGRQYPYSAEIPLEISMISNEEYNRNKMEIEERIRARIEAEYEDKLNSLRKQLDEKTISEEWHMRKLTELNDYYDKSSNLIDKLADRYARTDYDRLDSIDMRINSLIEQGSLDEAERLILSKGTKKALEDLKQSNLVLSKTLEEGKRAEAKMVQDYASELYLQFEIASMRFDNAAAAGFLKERMELDTSNVAWKMDYAAFVRDYLGQYDEAMAIYEGLLKATSDTRDLAQIYGSLGGIYQIKGDYQSALSSYGMSTELRECDSLLTSLADGYLNMSSVYLNLNKYDEADLYLQKAEKIYRESDDTLGLAGVYNKLTVMFSDKGEYEKAEEMLMKSLDMKLKLLGDDNLRIANEYINCAILMEELDRFKEAEDYVGKAIDIRRKILGENHPDIADAYQVSASIKVELGDSDIALDHYEKALAIFKRFYGDTHPEIASVYNNLGSFYNNVKNDFYKAIEYYTKALDMHRLLYGEIHSATATQLNNLASSYNDLAKYDTSLELYDQALKIWKEIYGDTHENVGDVYNNVSNVYYYLGKYNQADMYLRKALAIFQNIYGEDHSAVALAYENLGSICMELQQDQEALDYYAKASSIYKTIYGETHSHTANVYDKIGQIYYKHKMFDNAEAFLSEAMNIRIACLGDTHVAVASSYNNMGLMHQAKGEYATAEEMFIKALEINEKHYGAGHPKTATVLSSLSTLYKEQKQYDKALEYMLKALQMMESTYSEDHPYVMMYRYGLGDLYYTMGQLEDALPLLNWSYNKGLEATGPANSFSKRAFKQLHLIYNSIMGDNEYKGGYEAAMRALNENTVMYAEVAEGYQADQMGYSGEYAIVAYDEWELDDDEKCFLAFQASISNRPKKTYVFYRDGEFIPISFEGSLGIWLTPKWVTVEEKAELTKKFKRWYKKNRKNLFKN